MLKMENIQEITVEELTTLYEGYGFFVEYSGGEPSKIGMELLNDRV